MTVRALGAKGDGKTDNTTILNSILDGAANKSSILYFPFGVYIIGDTLRSHGVQGYWSGMVTDHGYRVQLREWNAQGVTKDRSECDICVASIDAGLTAYLENVWAWVADHDLDDPTKAEIDNYAARGILIESRHYQLSRATLFRTSLFPNGPTFRDCKADDASCYTSWALRIINSSDVYRLGAGLYSWFFNYNQDCPDTEDCQDAESRAWQHFAKGNVNGFLSSFLARLHGSEKTSGRPTFAGFQVYTLDALRNVDVPDTCKTALSSKVLYDYYVTIFEEFGYRGTLDHKTLTGSICDEGCNESLMDWFTSVKTSCQGYNISRQLPTTLSRRIPHRQVHAVDTINDMPLSEMCSDCHVKKLAMMQGSPYSFCDD
ncbi:hypothetical protein EDB80DRAFT_684201 [Ilyonectria destructans]|nr:hypothetical protein EDB80DRAFT_684201 [Ilyonectria destructans]